MPSPRDPRIPDAVVEIRDFGGMVVKADPHDLPEGTAIIQVNATSLVPGELRARGGSQVLKFD